MNTADCLTSSLQLYDPDEIVCLGIFPKQEPQSTEEVILDPTISPVLPPLVALSLNSRQSLYTTPTKRVVCDSQECSSFSSPLLESEDITAENCDATSDNSMPEGLELEDNTSESSDSSTQTHPTCNILTPSSSIENDVPESTTQDSNCWPSDEHLTDSPDSLLSSSYKPKVIGVGINEDEERRRQKLLQQLHINAKGFPKCLCDKLTTRQTHSIHCPGRSKRRRRLTGLEEEEQIEMVNLSGTESDLSDCSDEECDFQSNVVVQGAAGGIVEKRKRPFEIARRPKKKKKGGLYTFHNRSRMYEVASIVGSCFEKGIEYRMVHWKGYSSKQDTWELYSQLAKQVPDMLFKYEQKRKEKITQLNSDVAACFDPLIPDCYSLQDKNNVEASKCHSMLNVMCDPVPEIVDSIYIQRLQGRTVVNPLPKIAKKEPRTRVRKPVEVVTELSEGEKYSLALHSVLPTGHESFGSPTLKAKNIKKAIDALIKGKKIKKPSYVYLLIDPKEIEQYDIAELPLQSFLDSIFYIGKGSKSRSDQHLVDADRFATPNKDRKEPKVNRLLDCWENEGEIIPFHVFENADSDVAFLFEAAMIQAFGLKNLANKVRGHLSRFQSLQIDAKPSMDEIAEYGTLLLLDVYQMFKMTAGLYPAIPRDQVRFREKKKLEEESQASQQPTIQNSQSSSSL